MYGAIILSSAAVEVTTVRAAMLGDLSTARARLQSIQEYARRSGFVGGFPTYQDGNIKGKPAIGVAMLKPAAAEAIQISLEELRNR